MDNIRLTLGWFVGRRIAGQRKKNQSGETEGKKMLLSSDGHTLTDVNGLYLIPKEDE